MKSILTKYGDIVFLVFFGMIAWSITMVKSGFVYSYGIGFWGPNGHDGVWHIALANSLSRGSLEMPVFAGEQLKNYHIGFDLLLAGLHKLTFIPAATLYFQIIPPFLALAIGILVYRFVYLWKKSKSAAFWATFLVYFGGSWGPIISIIRYQDIGGESMFWAQQAISSLVNPPFALSLVLLLLGCLLLLRYLKRPTFWTSLLSIILFGVLTQIKVYAGVLALGSLGIVGVQQFIEKRNAGVFKIFIGSSFLSSVLFFPLNRNASALLSFQPFWFLETMMAVSDRANWPRFYEAIVNYKLGHVWWKLIPAYAVAILIFWLGNLGVRALGHFEIMHQTKEWDGVRVFLIWIARLGLVIPMFFVQTGTPWNTIQFFYYTIFVMSVFAGITIAKLTNQKGKIFCGSVWIVLCVFTLPGAYATLRNYVPTRPPAKLSGEELSALSFLSRQPDGIVLTYPYDALAAGRAESNPPRPLYLYESTAYVSAFSNQPVYLEDEVNLNISGYDWNERRTKVERWLNTLDQKEAYLFLRDNNIRYIYWVKPQRARLGEAQLEISRLFENSQVDIYKVN